ncbi:MAG TPA: CehA/McbA family metallohydrolase [Kiritimatiellia bacterium]|nr:CehA/McbA family metallohydrolase [Kiritimatiellia bacterium]HRR34966.1 CehA/McbA family metallohydrolase [Kiritimatiellia bacterium]
MKRRTFIRSGIAGFGAALLAGRTSAQESKPSKNEGGQPFAAPGNPFTAEGNWYKAALHVHTKTSDGDVDVATRLKQYREAGFQVVAVTDHWKTNDLTGYSDDAFLAINSMEMHPKTGTGAPGHHLVALDLPHPFELNRDQPAQEMIDTVKRAGGMVIYAHPHWTAHTLMEMEEVGGYVAMEVYNTHCDLASAKGFNRVYSDQMFNRGRLFGLVAVDDLHKSEWIGRGWTMIRARALDRASVMEALRNGHYYASCGPAIEDFRIENGVLQVQVSPVAEIRFLCNGAGGGRRFLPQPGEPLTTARWELKKGRKPTKWVYCEVVDAEGRHAWAPPIVI